MREAAQEMKSAAATMDYALERHRQWMDEWLSRFESAMAEVKCTEPGPPR